MVLSECLPLWVSSRPPTVPINARIEDYASGYPQYTALFAAHSPFFLFRRFDRLRARLLLLKQDGLSMLEQKLDDLDRNEERPLFLGKCRSDRNEARILVLADIETRLHDYDRFVESTRRILSVSTAERRDIDSLQNWVEGNGSLAREETAYLSHSRDLISLAPAADSATLQLETWVEDMLMKFCHSFRDNRYHDASRDPHVYIYSGPLIKRAARMMLLCLITLLLLMPVIVCNVIRTASVRIFVVVISIIAYLLIVSALTKSRTMDLILAAATYATVLIVFVSGAGMS